VRSHPPLLLGPCLIEVPGKGAVTFGGREARLTWTCSRREGIRSLVRRSTPRLYTLPALQVTTTIGEALFHVAAMRCAGNDAEADRDAHDKEPDYCNGRVRSYEVH
jgi:hypothetical protein